MKSRTVWSDTINGFPCEFVNWGFTEGEFDKWNYYIYFTAKNTSPERWADLLKIAPGKYGIGYYDSWLAELDWHCGITFAEFGRNSLQEIVSVKAGCDYSHYWDEGRSYCLQDLVEDCTGTTISARNLCGEPASCPKPQD